MYDDDGVRRSSAEYVRIDRDLFEYAKVLYVHSEKLTTYIVENLSWSDLSTET